MRRRTVRIALVALLLLAAAGCNTDALPPAAGYTTVSGAVLDRTSKPVAGAVVTIDAILSATTDTEGKFSISDVPSGIVDYTIVAQGYQVVSASASLEPGKTFLLNVTLDPGSGH